MKLGGAVQIFRSVELRVLGLRASRVLRVCGFKGLRV